MKDQASPDAHATLGALLRRPYERMSGWLYAELADSGFPDIRPAYSAVLRNLPPGGARVSELAARAGMTKQSMGYLVDQMSVADFVEIRPDPHDRRANTVRLTARGEQVVAKAVALSAGYERHLAGLLGERKMVQLRGLLTELHVRLEDEGTAPPPGA